jgi:hypothetical protein
MKWWIILVFILFFVIWSCASFPFFRNNAIPIPSHISLNFQHDSFDIPMPNGHPSLTKQDSYITGSGANIIAVETDPNLTSMSELEFFLPTNKSNEKHTIQMGFINLEPLQSLAGILNYDPNMKKYDLTCVFADKVAGELTQSETRTNRGDLPSNTTMILQLIIRNMSIVDVHFLTENRRPVLSVGLELTNLPSFHHAALGIQSTFCSRQYSVKGTPNSFGNTDRTRLFVTYEETDFQIFGMSF